MPIKYCKPNPRALVVLGILLGVLFIIPLCFAGGAATIVPAENRDLPNGSYIPKHRVEKIEKKATARKAQMKENAEKQKQEQSPQNESPRTEAPDEK